MNRGLYYPAVVCGPCGEKYGNRPVGVATWYPGTCGVCGAITHVTEPRDFGHLKDTWEEEPYNVRAVLDDRFPVIYPSNLIPISETEFIKLPEEYPHNPLDGVGPKPQPKNIIQIMNDQLARDKGFKVDAFSAFRLVPEVGELVDAVLKLEDLKKIKKTSEYEKTRLKEELRGEIGDVLVLLAQVATHYGMDLEECYMDTWHKIQNREFHN